MDKMTFEAVSPAVSHPEGCSVAAQIASGVCCELEG